MTPDFAPLLAAPQCRDWEAVLSHSAGTRGLGRDLLGRLPCFPATSEDALVTKLSVFDVVVAYPFSLNSLAKFALGLQDSLPTRVLGAAVERGIPVLLDDSALPPRDSAGNPHFIKVYRRHWEQVLTGLVHSFHAPDLEPVLDGILRHRRDLTTGFAPHQGKEVITRDDVLAAARAMQPLRVARGTIITPLARDEAVERGVAILHQE